MKALITLLLLSMASLVWSQDTQAKIEAVENSLNFPATFTFEQDIPKANILQRLKEEKIHGASVAVIHNGKIHWAKGYGVRELGSPEPVTTNTLFQCASIGKMITAIAAMQLVEKGLISLDENINEKLVRWKIKENNLTKAQPVTLRHLLSHSAGLTDEYGFLGYGPKDEIPTPLQILNGASPTKNKKSLEVKVQPGTVERYSGGGYLIVQLLIEDLTDISFAEYVEQNIFTPLGMQSATYHNRPDLEQGKVIAAGHLYNGKALKKKKYHIYPEKAAAGFWTTAEDLARFVLGVQAATKGESGAVLTQESIQEVLTPQINRKGLGVNLRGIEAPKAFWHAGQNLGYTGLVYGLIEEGEGAVILLNSDGGEKLMQEFVSSVALTYNWPVMKSVKSLPISKELSNRLAGLYRNDETKQEFSIKVMDGVPKVVVGGSKQAFQLIRVNDSEYTFESAQDYYRLSFNFEAQTPRLIYRESIGKALTLEKVN